jgi:hypothetical protein
MQPDRELGNLIAEPASNLVVVVNFTRQLIIMAIATWAIANRPDECQVDRDSGYNELGFTVMTFTIALFIADVLLFIIVSASAYGIELQLTITHWAVRSEIVLTALKVSPWIMTQVVAFGGSDDCSHYRYAALIITIVHYVGIVMTFYIICLAGCSYALTLNLLAVGVIAMPGNQVVVDNGFSWHKIHKLKQIQVRTYQPELADQHKFLNDNRECVCCMTAYEPGDKIYILPDGHHAHEACADVWFRQHSNCPSCREAIFVPDVV